MTLVERISADTVSALREKKTEELGVLRLLKNSFKNFAIAKRMPEDTLTDEQVVTILRQEIKKRKEAIEVYTSGGRPELAAKEKQEMDVIENYLPASMTLDELNAVIREVVAEQKLTPPYQFGSLMGAVVKKVAGKADGQTVKEAVQGFIAT